MKRYKAAQEILNAAKARGDKANAETAQNELNALVLFKGDTDEQVRRLLPTYRHNKDMRGLGCRGCLVEVRHCA